MIRRNITVICMRNVVWRVHAFLTEKTDIAHIYYHHINIQCSPSSSMSKYITYRVANSFIDF